VTLVLVLSAGDLLVPSGNTRHSQTPFSAYVILAYIVETIEKQKKKKSFYRKLRKFVRLT
jgi:hypothetical protein